MPKYLTHWDFDVARLRTCRELLGWSLEEAGKRLCTSGQTVSNWERGKTCPSMQDIARYANVAGFSPQSFFILVPSRPRVVGQKSQG